RHDRRRLLGRAGSRGQHGVLPRRGLEARPSDGTRARDGRSRDAPPGESRARPRRDPEPGEGRRLMASAGGRGPVARILLIVGALVALVLLGRAAGGALPEFAAAVERSGVWGPVVFVLGYAAATVAFVPGSVLTLAAGAIFGLAKGIVYVFVAA